ncbi:MAG: CBS domain-containing protein [Bryobacteraceae bacterium]
MRSTTKISAILEQKGSDIYAVTPKTTVFDAIAKMAEKGVGALLVMDGDTLQGVVSERDYTRKVILKGRSSREALVEEIMTRDVITASPEITVAEGMRLMTDHRIRHLPLVSGGRVVGVVSIGDLVKAIISEQEETIAHLTNYITGSY